MRRTILLLAASLAVPAMFTVLPASLASATTTPVIVSCTGFTGGNGSASATGCNHASISGGSGSLTSSSTGTAFTITWQTGLTASGTTTFKALSTSTCPAPYTLEAKDISTVTGGTATAMIGGRAVTKLCVDTSTGLFEVLPGTKAKI